MLVEPVQAGGPMQPAAGRKWAFGCRNEAQFLARGPGFLRCRIYEQGCCGAVDIFAIVAALGPICGEQRQYASLAATIDLKQAAPLANALFPSEIAAPASNVFFLSRQGIGDQVIDPEDERSEERRGGKGGVRTCRSRGWP